MAQMKFMSKAEIVLVNRIDILMGEITGNPQVNYSHSGDWEGNSILVYKFSLYIFSLFSLLYMLVYFVGTERYVKSC